MRFFLKLKRIIREGEKLQKARSTLGEEAFQRRLGLLKERLCELLAWQNPNPILQEVIAKVRRQEPYILTFINGEACGNGGEDIVAGGEFNPQNVIFGDVCTSVCGFAVDCPTPPFTIMAGILEEVTITGIGFDDAEGVVDSVQVQRSGPPADVSFNVVSNGRISAEITASTKGKLPRFQTLIVHKSDKSTAICEDGVEVLP